MITYPNREHQNEDRSARRRAAAHLERITKEVDALQRRLASEKAEVSGDETRQLTAAVRDLTRDLAIIEALRNVREWHAADEAKKAVTA